jgi:toxin-antitoxin system PIN domain toxin
VRALLDVNLLVALLDANHVHHDRAHLWWKEHRAGGWASCPLTQNGCLRVLSQPKYPNAQPLSAVHDLLVRQTASPDHAFWSDDTSLLDSQVFDHSRILGPSQLTDVYLLALAVRNGGRLATLDGGVPLAAVRGAETRHLVTL